jgi:hypothetical protein
MRLAIATLTALMSVACASSPERPYRLSPGDAHTEISAGTMARLQMISDAIPVNDIVIGELALSRLDSIAVITSLGERRTFPIGDIRSLRVRASTTNSGSGAAIGLIVGALVGAAVGSAAGDACSVDAYSTCSPGSSAAGGALVFGALGAGTGALLGRIRTKSWRAVPGPWRVVP